MRRGRAFSIGLAGVALCAGPAHADTLRQALQQAYLDNPTLEGARAQQRAEDENVPIQKAQGRPDVTGTGQYVEYLKSTSNNPTSPTRSFGANAELSVPVYTGGAVKNSVRAAETRVKAGRADLLATESAIFSRVVAAYMDVLRAQALVALNESQVHVLQINLEATSDRFEIGDLTRTDVAQSQSRLALAEGDLRNAKSNLIAARETYVQLVGQAPTDLQPPPPLPGLPDSVAKAVDTALHENPDLIAAHQRADAADYDIDAAGAARYPRVSLFTDGGYSNYLGTLGSNIITGITQAQTTASAGVRVQIPIYQGGLVSARQRQAQARSGAALEQVVATERDVIQQVRAAWASYQAALQIIDSSQAAIKAAALSLEGVRAENSIGNRTVLDVLNAEQELLNARAQLVTARRNAYVAGFTLLAAMGKVEARDLGLDGGVLYDPVVNYDRVKGQWWDWSHDQNPKTQSTRTVDIPAQTADIPDDAAADTRVKPALEMSGEGE